MLSGFISLIFAGLLAGPVDEPDTEPARPVLIELYTSQGCPLCPAANEYLGHLDAREDVVALSFSVDYWDIYGWEDTYARPEFVDRQRAFKQRLGFSRIYTPQFVIDGALEAGGSQPDSLLSDIATRRMTLTDTIEINVNYHGGGNFTIDIDGHAPFDEAATVYVAAYAPGWRSVDVSAGRNAGRDVRVYNPVTALFELGQWTSGADSYGAALPESRAGVFFVQGGPGGPIYAVADFRRTMDEASDR
ncbi:DUF1223 domain-containing protein [Hyphobacterium sp.]|uniref:DUF1223 domain-containing protein n=1 Tax=Hyphobacterium sp. TaxID=2004662 RepID=UPI003BA884E4